MEIKEYLNKMKMIHNCIIEFIDDEADDEEKL